MTIDVKDLPPAEYKKLLRQLQAEQKNRGPSGATRVPTNAAGLSELVTGVRRLAEQLSTDPVEILDAILRAMSLRFYITTKVKEEGGGST